MKYVQQTLPNGETRMVDATGKPLAKGDADRPLLHVLPKLLVPVDALGKSYLRDQSLIWRDHITLTVTSSLPGGIAPEGGIQVRQPYPNQRYFVGGSALIRNGWLVPLPLDVIEFDITFVWQIEAAWQVFRQDDWEIKHVIHVKLHPGKGMMYSMDSSCWPQPDGPTRRFGPVSRLGIEDDDPAEGGRRQIIKSSDLVYTGGEMAGELAGYYLEEQVDITGIPRDQAWTVDAFQEEQIHEVKHTAILKEDNDVHRKNGPVEMPPELLVRAIKLAQEVPFERDSEFGKSIAGIPGGMERHPAMRLLCDWWETVRPAGEPFKPGAAMPLVRVRDDGEYWWGYYETPNIAVEDFNPNGRDVARIGDLALVLFYATQEVAEFDDNGMTILLPSGEPYSTIGVDKESFLRGEVDEAWYCLRGLKAFPSRFPAAWEFLNGKGGEYAQVRRMAVERVVPLPKGTKNCTCGNPPVLTEDPTVEGDGRFHLTCAGTDGDKNHTHLWGATLEEILNDWNDDYDLIQLGASEEELRARIPGQAP